MNIKFLTIIFLLSISLVGCKNEKTNKETVVETENQEIDDTFTFTLDALVKVDDNFQIYYNESPDEVFTEEKSVWIEVKGMNASQQISFKLPVAVVPALIRLDLGLSDKQDEIIINGFEMNYLGKKFSSRKPEMANFLRGADIDFNTGILTPQFRDGKRIEPVLYPHEVPLGIEIANLVQ
jgi:hypothetical protein